MLGQQQQPVALQHRRDALVDRLEPGDRGEQAERAALRRLHQRRETGGDLADIVARDVVDDEDARLRGVIERRGDADRARARR